MKKSGIFTTMLAAVAVAAVIPASFLTAYADEGAQSGNPTYPESFTRTLDMSADGLTDYAVDGDTYAFAVKTTVYLLSTDESGDRKLTEFTYGTQIVALDYADGKLYFQSTSGNAYCYPDVTATVEHVFPEPTNRMIVGDDWYTLNVQTGGLSRIDAEGRSSNLGEGFSLMKRYGDVVYAVKDDCPYALNGAEATALNLDYTDFSAADNVPVGNIPQALRSSDYRVTTATLEKDAYYTQIDPDDTEGTFTQIKTLKAAGAISCLVLATDGDLSVIATDDGCFITATDNLTPTNYTAPANDWKAGANGERKAYLRAQTGIYASPYMCSATRLASLSGDALTVVAVTEKFSLDFIGGVFYRVAYTDENGQTLTGFVAAGFLDEYDYAAENEDKTTVRDDEFVYDTNVTTVILVLVIVGLVILAIVYLTLVGTKNETPARGKKKKAKNEQEEE